MADVLVLPEAEIEARVRWLTEAELIGFARWDGVTDVELAWWFIALLASPSPEGGPAAARRLGGYRCANWRVLRAAGASRVAVIETFLPLLPEMTLIDVLTQLILYCKERRPVDVWSLAADWPPHDGFRINVRFADYTPLTLVFRANSDADRWMMWRSRDRSPLKMTREVDGVAFTAALPFVARAL